MKMRLFLPPPDWKVGGFAAAMIGVGIALCGWFVHMSPELHGAMLIGAGAAGLIHSVNVWLFARFVHPWVVRRFRQGGAVVVEDQ